MAADNNQRIAADVLTAIGGMGNVTKVLNCMTRLRFTLKDSSVVNLDDVKAIDGVLGAQWSGIELQVIIGTNVKKVYEAIETQGASSHDGAASNADATTSAGTAPKEKLTLAKIGQNIIGYLSGSMVPLTSVCIAAGLIRALMTVLGPELLGLISETSGLYTMLDFVYDAGFYFLPILIGFNAAKVLNVPELLGAYMGCILIAPDLVSLAASDVTSLDVLGLPIAVNDYSQSVLPIILSVWIMSYVYKLIAKVMPDALTTVLTPFLTVIIMIPISLGVLAPIGSVVGNAVSNGLIAFGQVGGFVAVGVASALWEFLVLTGMHWVLVFFMLNEYLTTGVMTGVAVAGVIGNFAAFGIALGAFLRHRDKKAKTLNFGFFLSGLVGGVVEPVLYGTCFKYPRTFISLVVGGLLGGAFAGIMNVKMYVSASSNILMLLNFVGGDPSNVVYGVISCLISFVSATAFTYFFGFKKEDIDGAVEESRKLESGSAEPAEQGEKNVVATAA